MDKLVKYNYFIGCCYFLSFYLVWNPNKRVISQRVRWDWVPACRRVRLFRYLAFSPWTSSPRTITSTNHDLIYLDSSYCLKDLPCCFCSKNRCVWFDFFDHVSQFFAPHAAYKSDDCSCCWNSWLQITSRENSAWSSN